MNTIQSPNKTKYFYYPGLEVIEFNFSEGWFQWDIVTAKIKEKETQIKTAQSITIKSYRELKGESKS